MRRAIGGPDRLLVGGMFVVQAHDMVDIGRHPIGEGRRRIAPVERGQHRVRVAIVEGEAEEGDARGGHVVGFALSE